MASSRLFDQTYGRFEFRARFPATDEPGLKSALWLYPSELTDGKGPNSGEIDVVEWCSGNATQTLPAIHYQGAEWPTYAGWDCGVPTAAGSFHTYAVEWSSSVMDFYYDGEKCWSTTWDPDDPLVAPQPFDHPFFFVMNLGFGTGWNDVTSETLNPATLQVDWVRAWK